MTDDYSQQWDELEEKEILIGILTELQQIRLHLQGAESQQENSEQMFECTRCGTTVTEANKAEHARKSHKAPPGLEDNLFSKV